MLCCAEIEWSLEHNAPSAEVVRYDRLQCVGCAQEGALTALASVADCSQDYFAKYYGSVMPQLKTILLAANVSLLLSQLPRRVQPSAVYGASVLVLGVFAPDPTHLRHSLLLWDALLVDWLITPALQCTLHHTTRLSRSMAACANLQRAAWSCVAILNDALV